MFKELLKRRRLPFIGEFTDAFFTTLPFLSIYSSVSITIILYAQVSEWLLIWFPWITLWKFMLLASAAIGPVLFVAYKYILPSLWHSRSKQMFHLENKLDEILDILKKGEK